jgi:uncharacterized protein (TIGR03437 family)
MRRVISTTAWFMAMGSAAAQTIYRPVKCSQDSQGNQICVTTQPNQNVCGLVQGSGFFPDELLQCDDVVVQKTRPDGRTIYTHVLGGESDQVPSQFIFDAQENVVLFGTTYSKRFPVTPDAAQSSYAGPQPPAAVNSHYTPLPPGGDLFLSILAPSGDLLYSTFLGSSGNDTMLGVRAAPNGQVDVLAGPGASDFAVVPAGTATLSSGPVLLTFDLNRRTIVRSGYLAIAPPGSTIAYNASIQDAEIVAVSTLGGLYTFGRDGQQRTFASLESFEFSSAPGASTDPAGDVWLVGSNKNGQLLVAKLTAGTVEAFRWTLPVANDSLSFPYLLPPFFGPDGLTYLGGGASIRNATGNGKLLSTTPNAMLEAPCSPYFIGIMAVLSAQGEVKMLTYLASDPTSFATNPDGSVLVTVSDASKSPVHGTRIPVDLTQDPQASCVMDSLDRLSSPPPAFGVGQIVRLRGGRFGPDSPVSTAPGPDQRFPTSLNDLAVDVGGLAAPILSAGPGEVVIAIPFEVAESDSIPVVVKDHGRQSAALQIPVRAAAPWFVDPVLNADGTPNTFMTPAQWGSKVTVFVTGAGPYTPSLDDGQVPHADTLHRLQLPVSVSFGAGPSPEPGLILYAGPAPGFVGLAQIDFQLPPQPASVLYRSDVDILPILTIGSVSVYVPSIWLAVTGDESNN